MTTNADIITFLDQFAPSELAESWDNVGLLLGDRNNAVSSVMTCLTLTPNVAQEAVDKNADLIVSHHPILFRAVQQITADNSEGAMLLKLVQSKIAVFSPHTRYDSATEGINRQLAGSLGLNNVSVLRPLDDVDRSTGAGRYGDLAVELSLGEFNEQVKQALGITNLQYVGDMSSKVRRVGIACGAAAEFLRDAKNVGCDVLLTGEARFHACLEAEQLGMCMVLPGHYATERPAMENLVTILGQQFSDLTIWSSDDEYDPVRWD